MKLPKTHIEFVLEKAKKEIQRQNKKKAKEEFGQANTKTIVNYFDDVLVRVEAESIKQRIGESISDRAKNTSQIIKREIENKTKDEYSFNSYRGLKDDWIIIKGGDIPGGADWIDMRTATMKSSTNQGRWKAVLSSRYIDENGEKTVTSRCLRVNTKNITDKDPR